MKVNSAYSIWKDIFMVFPKVPYLDLCFSIYTLCNLFYFLKNTDITSYADNKTPYPAEENRKIVINTIETLSQILFNWFNDNLMKANSGKNHLLISGTETTHVNIYDYMIKSSKKKEKKNTWHKF